MGGEQFSVWETGKTAKEAFAGAVSEAQYDHGHAGYTGTIAEKSEFVMIEDDPKDVLKKVEGQLLDLTTVQKLLLGGVEISKEKLDKLVGRATGRTPEDQAKNFDWPIKRREDDKARLLKAIDKGDGKEIAEAVAGTLDSLNDPRISGKWGPAGCIHVKDKFEVAGDDSLYYFFGWASS